MVKFRNLFLIAFILMFSGTIGQVYAQKKPMDSSVYDSWQYVTSSKIPYNGRYLFYSISEQEGDNVLYIKDLQNGKTISVPRGVSANISKSGNVAVCIIRASYKDRREAKIAKKKDYEMPKDTLAVINLKTGDINKLPNIGNYDFGNDLTGILVAKKEQTEKSEKGRTPLLVIDSRTMHVDTICGVNKFNLSDNGERLIYSVMPEKKDSTGLMEIYSRSFVTGQNEMIYSCDREIKVKGFYFNENASKVAFYAQPDTSSEYKDVRNIYIADFSGDCSHEAKPIITNELAGMPEGFGISEKSTIHFSENEDYLIFGVKELPKEEKDTVPDFEKVRMQVWVWNDDYLPTMKTAPRNMTKNPPYTAVFYFDRPDRIITLADEDIPLVYLPDDLEGDKLLLTTDKPYRISQQWDAIRRYDVYELNIENGSREKLAEDVRISSRASSPDRRYTVYFDYADTSWHIYDAVKKNIRNLTSGLPSIFWSDEKQHPVTPGPCGYVIWYSDGSAFCINSQYDVWRFDPTGEKPAENLTDGIGEKNKEQFEIYQGIFYSEDAETYGGQVQDNYLYPGEPLIFSSFNKVTRETGFYKKDEAARRPIMVKLVEGGFTYDLVGMVTSYEYPDIVKKSHKKVRPPRKLSVPVIVYTKGNFENPNDLYYTSDYFRTENRLTDINPQMDDYLWGTVEMVDWKTEDGIDAQGLLYKPENLDTTKKYPVIVYFYEKCSDELYKFKMPAPSRSIVNIPFYVSNGYVVFVPDIYYEDGHPGQSAMRSIMPGVDRICEYSWIDENKIALQGQSWGGYQTAYMITQTGRFAAAGAGAPVANMTSAYGGIRWESGMSRQSQYEQTQSRIGTNLWDGLDLYIENSPAFFVPNVTTPVLIMHNDADGAVPWYQGIEFFTDLRRCGKQAWMLQYRDESHNLSRRHNCKDYTIKLMEFFDHFLKGAPMPDWMKQNN